MENLKNTKKRGNNRANLGYYQNTLYLSLERLEPLEEVFYLIIM